MSDDEDIEINFSDDPGAPIPEGAARFELMYPNPEKYPNSTSMAVKITFEDMSLLAAFPSERYERFQDLLRCFDRVVVRLIEAKENEVQIQREAKGLDDELAGLLDEEVEE